MKTTARYIYFAGARSANKEATNSYHDILAELNKYGDLVNATNYEPEGTAGTSDERFARMEEHFVKANILIAEVSTPSHGVGREISYAQHVKKIPVVCLYKADTLPSPILQGNPDIDVFPYETLDDIKQILKIYFTQRSA